MKMKVSYDKVESNLSGCSYVKVEVDGHTFHKQVAGILGSFVNKHNYIEVSDKPFEGSSVVEAMPNPERWHNGFKFVTPKGKKLWACASGLRDVGLTMSKLGKVYIKTR